MRKRTAATIMELIVTVSVCSTVLGVAGMAYVSVIKRSARDATASAVAIQASALADDLTRWIRRCNSAKVSGTGVDQTLELQLALGTDTSGDGLPDSFAPTKVQNDGTLQFDNGPKLTFMWSDLQGKASKGNVYWRKIGGSGGYDGMDATWSLSNGGARWNLLESIDFAVDSTAGTVKFTIVASSLSRADQPASGTEANSDFTRITLTRVVAMRSGN